MKQVTSKACSMCAKVLPYPASFNRGKGYHNGYRPHCKTCQYDHARKNREKYREYARKWYYKNLELSRAVKRKHGMASYWRNPEKRREQAKVYAARVPKDVKAVWHKRWLAKKYNLTVPEYEAMKSRQNGLCAICERVPSSVRGLFVDHDHATGKVRGMLCCTCNAILGMARDNETILSNAIAYLRKSEPGVMRLVSKVE